MRIENYSMSQHHMKEIDDSAYLSENVITPPFVRKPYNLLIQQSRSDPRVPSSPTLRCLSERSLGSLSSRWKAEGNGSHTGNFRTGTKPIHLPDSRPLRTPVTRGPASVQVQSRTSDWMIKWFGLALPNLEGHTRTKSSTLHFNLTVCHGRLNHRLVCCNRPNAPKP